jgi:thioredoxin 1
MELNKDNFKTEVLDYKDGPVLVDFSAPWCGTCLAQAPIVNELAKDLADTKFKIGFVNVDLAADLAEQYGVMSLPTLIVFRNGEVKATLNGLHNKEDLRAQLEKQR